MAQIGKLFIVASSLDDCCMLEQYLGIRDSEKSDSFLEQSFSVSDWEVSKFDDPDVAIRCIKEECPSVVVVDLPIKLMEEQFGSLPSQDIDTAYVAILPEVNPRSVAKYFHNNVSDVLIKPFSSTRFRLAIDRAANFKSLVRQNREYREQLEQANRELKENVRILKIDQMAGRQVQHSLLPKTPFYSKDYEIAHKIIPSLYLSGDFVGYDTILDRYLVFYVADVSGHGSSSAFVTVLLKFIYNGILRRHIAQKEKNAMVKAPEGFIEHINRQILALGLDKHLTIFSACIDMETNSLRYSVAAHMPTPLFISGDNICLLPGKGKPVGIFPDASWDVEEIALPEKFAMVLLSDGVLEFLPGKSLEEKEHYIADSVAKTDKSLEQVCEKLGINQIKDVPDDVTVLTLRRGY